MNTLVNAQEAVRGEGSVGGGERERNMICINHTAVSIVLFV